LICGPDTNLAKALHPSPNFEPRRGVDGPDMLLFHYTGMRSCHKAIDWLSRPQSRVSCHYVIDTDGTITQMVEEKMRAWHAGVSCWEGEVDINSRSIGFEIHNPGHDDGYPDFPEAQMQAVMELARDCIDRWKIRPERVLAHSDVAPQRKIDPGEKFDWQRLHAAGIGVWLPPSPVVAGDEGVQPGAAGEVVGQVQRLLQAYGFQVPQTGVLDGPSIKVVAAFQRHFRPERVDGCIDRSTVLTLQALLALLGRDCPPVA
jgi:N-acetylmuramoyl-L-alanine amidase